MQYQTRTTLALMVALSLFGFTAHADQVSTTTQDAQAMVDVCNAAGGNGWMNKWGGHCIAKDGKTTTDCKAETKGDNCTTIVLIKNVDRPKGAASGVKHKPKAVNTND
jgi:hypothetical protein